MQLQIMAQTTKDNEGILRDIKSYKIDIQRMAANLEEYEDQKFEENIDISAEEKLNSEEYI